MELNYNRISEINTAKLESQLNTLKSYRAILEDIKAAQESNKETTSEDSVDINTKREALKHLKYEIYEEGHCSYLEEEITIAIQALEREIEREDG